MLADGGVWVPLGSVMVVAEYRKLYAAIGDTYSAEDKREAHYRDGVFLAGPEILG